MRGLWLVAGFASAVTAQPVPLMAQPVPVVAPKLAVSEGMQILEAAGYRLVGGRGVNKCGTPARPRFSYYDLNQDGQLEAMAADNDACFGGPVVTVVAKKPNGVWTVLFRTEGTLAWMPTRTRGWFDAKVTKGCETIWLMNGAGYLPSGDCLKVGAPVAVAAVPLAKKVPAGVPFAGAFTAAGFVRRGKAWIGCDGQSTADVAEDGVRDLNKDGVDEVVIADSGSACYGNVGQGFTIMTPAPGGKWRAVFSSSGIPEFLKTSAGGWPDIEVGGPGFCFPVMRWNGKGYALFRRQAKSPGGCG